MMLQNELRIAYIFECLYENYLTVYPTLKDLKLAICDLLDNSGSVEDMSISVCIIDSDVDIDFDRSQSCAAVNKEMTFAIAHWISANKFMVEGQEDIFRVFSSKYLYINKEDVYCNPDEIDPENVVLRTNV